VPVLHPPTPHLASLQSCMSGEARGGAIPVVAALYVLQSYAVMVGDVAASCEGSYCCRFEGSATLATRIRRTWSSTG